MKQQFSLAAIEYAACRLAGKDPHLAEPDVNDALRYENWREPGHQWYRARGDTQYVIWTVELRDSTRGKPTEIEGEVDQC